MFKKKELVIRRGVALFDLHAPDEDKAALQVAYDFTLDFQPDIFIWGGDQMHMDCISFYNRNRPKLLEGQRLHKEYLYMQKILDRFERILSSGCKKYFFIGNHEYRVDRFLESNPMLEGSIEVEHCLELDDYTVVPFNEVLSIGKMNFIHGIYYNKYHSFKHLSVYEDNIFYGHVHHHQVFPKTTPLLNLPKHGVSVGCLCNCNPGYMRNKPNSWEHGFLFWYMFDDGSFNYYHVNVINGRAVINNKLYVGG